MAITFFKTPKHKQFKYRPLFYDEKKEELEKLKRESVSGDDFDEAALRDRLELRWKRSRRSQDKKFTKMRFIVILLVLALVAWLLLK